MLGLAAEYTVEYGISPSDITSRREHVMQRTKENNGAGNIP